MNRFLRARGEGFLTRGGSNRVSYRCCPLLGLLTIVIGCSGEPPLVCDSAPEGIGTWVDIPRPMMVSPYSGLTPQSGSFASDGAKLFFVQESCGDCSFSTLTEDRQWAEEATSHYLDRLGQIVISPQYFASIGGLRVENGWHVEVETLALLDRRIHEWTVHERPEGLAALGQAHWTGGEFVVWGARQFPGIPGKERNVGIQYYDGAFLEPEMRSWTMIPPFREAVEYSVAQGGPSLRSVWTPKGLFVWGMTPERTSSWGAIFDRRLLSWLELATDGERPPPREDPGLIALGSDVYLYGGKEPGKDELSRRLFRYSLEHEAWKEIPVPEWADLRRAAIVAGKLAWSGRCEGGALYDPKADSWAAFTREGAPITGGNAFGFGDTLAMADMVGHGYDPERVWLLKLGE